MILPATRFNPKCHSEKQVQQWMTGIVPVCQRDSHWDDQMVRFRHVPVHVTFPTWAIRYHTEEKNLDSKNDAIGDCWSSRYLRRTAIPEVSLWSEAVSDSRPLTSICTERTAIPDVSLWSYFRLEANNRLGCSVSSTCF